MSAGGRLAVEPVNPAYHFVDRPETQPGHDLAQIHGDKTHEVFDMLRLAREAAAQVRVLCGHADRAGVEVADAHHDTAE